MRLSFHPLVQREVSDAMRWYDEQRQGLGETFFARLTSVLDSIAAQPDGYRFWLGSKTVRRARLSRFPYAILYEIRPGNVRILCVRHDKRHPAYGATRA